ncbi:MAG: hypothetical protein HZC40_09270 [Chloroflexi bacterium]|nr:hypothetical protein [Chloroflexota bacterium]
MKTRFAIMFLTFSILFAAPIARAQGSTPSADNLAKIVAITRVLLDTLQGKASPDANALFEQSRQAATLFASDLFLLDFGNPNLPLNQFAATLATNLLALTPLYVFGYIAILIYNVWKERAIPNPLVYGALVIGVMIFLAAFAVITQGMSELGIAIATAFGGAGSAMFARATLLDTILRVMLALQKNGGAIAPLVLLVALIEMAVILIQLAYRGISMAIWRLFGVLLIPLSVLLEGVNPKTAGKVIAGFFEAWLDMVGKITLLLITLSLASADSLASYVWIVLPAGLFVVIVSWKFFGVLFALIRDAVARAWNNFAPADAPVSDALPASAEAARAKEIEAERRRLMKE